LKPKFRYVGGDDNQTAIETVFGDTPEPRVVITAVKLGLLAAITAVRPLPQVRHGSLGQAGRTAARKLIQLYCEVHQVHAPRFHVRKEAIANPRAAEFALTTLRLWHVTGSDIDILDLVRSTQLSPQRPVR
jgi:hypothetical protein